MNMINDIAAGVIGGLAGGMVMTAAMLVGKQIGVLKTPMLLQ